MFKPISLAHPSCGTRAADPEAMDCFSSVFLLCDIILMCHIMFQINKNCSEDKNCSDMIKHLAFQIRNLWQTKIRIPPKCNLVKQWVSLELLTGSELTPAVAFQSPPQCGQVLTKAGRLELIAQHSGSSAGWRASCSGSSAGWRVSFLCSSVGLSFF